MALLCAASVALYLGPVTALGVPDLPARLPMWVLAIGFGVGELCVLHLHFKREAHTISLSEIPLVMGLFFVAPTELVVAHVVGSGLALALHRRQSLLKLTFNVGQWALGSCIAVLVFHNLVTDPRAIGPVAWLAALIAALALDMISALAVSGAIFLSEGRMQARDLWSAVASGSAAAMLNAALALVAVTALVQNPSVGWLLLLVLGIFMAAYRAYSVLRQRHSSLELVWDFTKGIERSQDERDVVLAVCERAAEALRAETVEIVLAEDVIFRYAAAECAFEEEASVEGAMNEALLELLAAGSSILMPRTTKDIALRHYLDVRGFEDCIAAPLRGEGRTFGHILVADRLSDVATFEVADLTLLETLAGHASVALERGRLVETLRQQAAANEYQAQHDPLTDLFNRSYFQRATARSLEAAEPGQMLAVLLMDLDRFKEINDTLGHHTGDDVLKSVAARLLEVCEKATTVARLGGDEFAVLLPTIGEIDEAIMVAEKIHEALGRPFPLEELTLQAGATIGIATFPEHGLDAEVLLQRADVAMYVAKEGHRAYEVYSPEQDKYSAGRLALLGELRGAIEARKLEVWYQPRIELDSGEVGGVEALVRWNHPVHGMLPPSEFIPLAEHAGLIGALTYSVLEIALDRCKEWRESGLEDFEVAVNLSPRSLLDASLPREVARRLRARDLPAGALRLEITEDSIMTDPERSLTTLKSLRDLGIGISIDDFGTGYSSLTYLKKFPIDEIKIDRSFVMNMGLDANDALIVRSVIDLGNNLGLKVVAEGIEDERSLKTLIGYGCTDGQGFLFSRPLPAPALSSWLAERAPARASRTGDGVVVPLVNRA